MAEVVLRRRGCPPGGWPSQQAKKALLEKQALEDKVISEAMASAPKLKDIAYRNPPPLTFTGSAISFINLSGNISQAVELTIKDGVVTEIIKHDEDIRHLAAAKANKIFLERFILGMPAHAPAPKPEDNIVRWADEMHNDR